MFTHAPLLPINVSKASCRVFPASSITNESFKLFSSSTTFAGSKSVKGGTVWLFTRNLIKPLLHERTNWSSGMLSNLLFTLDVVLSKKFLNPLNARLSWGIWAYMHSIWWPLNSKFFLQKFNPWSIRIRRFFKLSALSGTFTCIGLSREKFYTPTRRIKRWLKKKYTTQSWR